MKTDASRFISPQMHVVTGEDAFAYLARAQEHERHTGRPVIYLTVGQPNFDPHEEIIQQCVDSLRAPGGNGYTVSRGIPQLLEAAARYMSQTRGIDVSSDSIVVGMGSKMVTKILLTMTVRPGDEVVYQEPGYRMYLTPIRLCGGTPVPVPVREENGFVIDTDELRSFVTDRTRVLILNYPSNPTGGVADRRRLEEIFSIAEEHDLFILSDEVYSQIVYEQPFESIGSLPGALERVAIIESGSKGHAMTGWRVGCAVVPPVFVEPYTRLFENDCTCLPMFVQRGAAHAFRDSDGTFGRWIASMVEDYRTRRQALVDGINAISGLSCHKPGGAFYAFANVAKTGLSSEMFANRLLNETDVAVLPGTAFGQYGEGFIRLSFANSLANLREALQRIDSFVSSL
ncbi:MAG: aminotransferase class I/II-fold pyridoxal phosphate-dependent enzyme [Patescibacteria group bacterium]